MAIIRPSVELRNNYNEISKICHETKEPVYITRNGNSDLVVLSNEAYEKIEEGKYVPAEQAFKELEEKYNLWKNIILI